MNTPDVKVMLISGNRLMACSNISSTTLCWLSNLKNAKKRKQNLCWSYWALTAMSLGTHSDFSDYACHDDFGLRSFHKFYCDIFTRFPVFIVPCQACTSLAQQLDGDVFIEQPWIRYLFTFITWKLAVYTLLFQFLYPCGLVKGAGTTTHASLRKDSHLKF